MGKMLLSDPDAVEFGGFRASRLCLLTKQIRELHFQQFLARRPELEVAVRLTTGDNGNLAGGIQ